MILDEILSHKRVELQRARAAAPLEDLKKRAADAPEVRPFAKVLRHCDRLGLIAEVKRASPSAGVIREDFDPVGIAQSFEAAGADCLSVLTDECYFQGKLEYVAWIREATSLPILRKDFTISEYHVYEARAAGADAVLLLAAALSQQEIADFASLAADLGMAALIETHTEAEMFIAKQIEAELIGINSRDLQTFITDIAVVDRLSKLAPSGSTLVAESGIKTRADVDRVRTAGAHAILVGETLMRSDDIGATVRRLIG